MCIRPLAICSKLVDHPLQVAAVCKLLRVQQSHSCQTDTKTNQYQSMSDAVTNTKACAMIVSNPKLQKMPTNVQKHVGTVTHHHMVQFVLVRQQCYLTMLYISAEIANNCANSLTPHISQRRVLGGRFIERKLTYVPQHMVLRPEVTRLYCTCNRALFGHRLV